MHFVPDLVNKTDLPGLVGDVRLRGQAFATCDDVHIIVDLYAASSGDILLQERWIIGPEHMSKTAKIHGAGLDCKLVLPLSTYRPDTRHVKLHVRVESTRQEAADGGLSEPRPGLGLAPSGAVLGESIIELGAEQRGKVPMRPLDKR